MTESEWIPEAYRDALRRARQRTHGLNADSLLEARPAPITGPGPEAVLPEPETADDDTALAIEPPADDREGVDVPFGDRDDQADDFKMPRPVGFIEPLRLSQPR